MKKACLFKLMWFLLVFSGIFPDISSANLTVLIDNSEIDVFGTLYTALYPPENTIDDDLFTFWHGTDNIQWGDTNYLAYHFTIPYIISRIDFTNERHNTYALGELDIQISLNSKDGLDGDWITIDHIDGDFEPPSGDFIRLIYSGSTSWIRLWMTYEGRAACGITPAFYLSEIDFYTIPAPGAIILGCIGAGFAGWLRRKRAI